jgi:hypothetical protein
MTLGQFAVAVGASTRWVQNALRALRPRPRYTPQAAQRLAFAHAVHARLGVPLGRGYELAREALAAWPRRKVWEYAADDAVTLRVDLERFLSACAVRLSLSRTYYGEKRRGRPHKHVRHGIAGARDYGVDIGLLHEQLKRTPEERLRRLDEAVVFVQSLKIVG